jgi:hypothetical protein
MADVELNLTPRTSDGGKPGAQATFQECSPLGHGPIAARFDSCASPQGQIAAQLELSLRTVGCGSEVEKCV